MKKVGGDEKADVDVKGSENESSEDDDETSVELLDFCLETGSVSKEEREQSKKEVSCYIGSRYCSHRRFITKKPII